MTVSKIMVFAGISTLLQAAGQMTFTSLGLLQYFCVIDFLRDFPILLYIRILYFHNPAPCGSRINIGQAIDGVANSAFVLLTREPFTAFRTFIINCTSLGLSAFWIVTSFAIMIGGAKNNQSKIIRWPWIIITVATCGVDLVATVSYANDSFHTRTLSDIMEFIGGTVSGIGSTELNTSWASWTMVILYSRLVVLFALNIFLVILVIINFNIKRETFVSSGIQVEAPVQINQSVAIEETSQDLEESRTPSIIESMTRIPRPGLSQSFRRMKALLFRKSPTPEPRRSNPDSIEASPERTPRVEQVDMDKKRTVNFPENLLSLPQRLENMIAEQQRRLDKAVIDTTGRLSPPRASQSLPQLATTSNQADPSGRRGTTVELKGQLPWAYIHASAHRMRDQLPPDEDLPPVPLPDYTALQSRRKASVHRAASSLSSLTQKRDYALSKSARLPPLTQSDVLY